MPPPPPTGEKLQTPPTPKPKGEETAQAAPATLVVTLPAAAKLMIDDNVTSSTTGTRVFVSPALKPGKEFTYTLKGELTVDGQTLTAIREVKVRAGQETRVRLEFPVATVALR
jgi:uncharacterized protein (TIGR03000 family)